MFRSLKALAASCVLLAGGSALAAPALKDLDPAAIMITADSARVSVKNGKTRLELKNTAGVVSAVAALNGKRRFETFPLRELPQSWNSCNDMKDANKWWHDDGFNAAFQFDSGAAKLPENAHFAKSRLLTAPQNRDTTIAGAAGAAKLKLLHAELRGSTLAFEIAGGKLTPGTYRRIGLLVECVID